MTVNSLANIRRFDQLVKYLRDELDWPIQTADFDDLTFDFTPEELGIDPKNAAKIEEIKRLRPLSINQPWGVFFVKFEPKRLPIVALRRILSSVVLKRRASANPTEFKTWAAEDLLFISNYGGGGDDRQITFAHFTQATATDGLPTLKVLGWDNLDTPLHIDHVAESLRDHLRWPRDEDDAQAWREEWRQAFTVRYGEVITTSRVLAIRLAELARAIRDRIRSALAIESETGPLTTLFRAFREALVHDLDSEGFADMYAQTIAYGLLSARIASPHQVGQDGLATQMPITSPFLKELMETFLSAGGRRGGGATLDFDEVGVGEVVELLDRANMEAVVRDFGDRNPQEDPVVHFYELFVKQYDAKKRMQRGVFYTPRPVVSYIVRSVHERLRTELGLIDGLADTATWGEMAERHQGLTIPDDVERSDRFVNVLDPATGTGTFLVEVIDVVHRTLTERWRREGCDESRVADLWNAYVPTHLLPRLHGFELMMAPYAIAHLKIGLKLRETGYRFESDERVRVYLTNALEPAHDFSGTLEFAIPALAHEAEAVNTVKRHRRFTVVVGNPPYSGESANKIRWIEQLVRETYQHIDGVPLKEKGKKNWLLDDYVKFLRLAHLAIRRSGIGYIGYVINNAFQDNPTFRGLRHSFLTEFTSVQILDLHGSGRRVDSGADAAGDSNVFDIIQGVCILVLGLDKPPSADATLTRYDLWGSRDKKYHFLSGSQPAEFAWDAPEPKSPQWYLISLDLTNESEWEGWIPLTEAFPVNGNGLISAKDHFAYAMSPEELNRNIGVFLDEKLSDEEVSLRLGINDNSMWTVNRGRLRLRSELDKARLCRVAYLPFDTRYSIFHRDVIFNLRLPVTQYIVGGGNLVLLTTRMTKGAEWRHCFVTRDVSDCRLLSSQTSTNAFVFPLYRDDADRGGLLLADAVGRTPNFSAQFSRALDSRLGFSSGTCSPEDVFHYVYAMLHSPTFRSRYAEFLKLDFPRLPITDNLELFLSVAERGKELASMHLGESPAQQAVSARYDAVAQAWQYHVDPGHQLPITLSFSGSDRPIVGQAGWSDGTVWIDTEKPKKGGVAANMLGKAGFSGVPETVWNFPIGGYQVCHKWLKVRRGRTLTADDITHYHRIVIAIQETIRIMSEIDEQIEQAGGWPGAFTAA